MNVMVRVIRVKKIVFICSDSKFSSNDRRMFIIMVLLILMNMVLKLELKVFVVIVML